MCRNLITCSRRRKLQDIVPRADQAPSAAQLTLDVGSVATQLRRTGVAALVAFLKPLTED